MMTSLSHWISPPSIVRRRIIIEQCQLIDPGFSVRMSNIHVEGEN